MEKLDLEMMRKALKMAEKSSGVGEVPIGAVLTDQKGVVLAAEGNNCILSNDPVGHAEIRALRAAAIKRNNYRLPGTTMYVTLEPCSMCATALIHARVARLVYGADDPKAGAIVSKYKIGTDGLLNHRFEIEGGLLAEECSRLLKEFFRARRGKSKVQAGMQSKEIT
jgi:tRNA(adenine34) deaminase